MPLVTSSDKHAWWSDLRHSGLLISPALLEELFPGGPDDPPEQAYERLRDRYTGFGAWLKKQKDGAQGEAQPLHTWLDTILEDFLGHERARWRKGPNVPKELTVETALGQRLRPNRVLYLDGDKTQPALVVWVDRAKRIGMGASRKSYGNLLEFLRGSGIKLGLLTNGSQFRLCYAGLDHDAWVEWEAENWMDEGELRLQLHGFYTLLGPNTFKRRDGVAFPLLKAVEDSRTRQGELSTVLGEQVRQAVELLLSEVDRAARKDPTFLDIVRRAPDKSELSQKRVLDALYQAASRIVMRMVVILFAEARELLPRNLESYNSSYGLEGLFEQLRKAVTHEGFLALTERLGAWPRVISLFKLIHAGSAHPAIPVSAYGGLLFQSGSATDSDPVLRALALFEAPDLEVSDATVQRTLELLKIGSLKIKRGRTVTWARGPVDFGQLRTEYIGILYEGLLDYELKAAERTTVFLNIGQQPILPLDILENMSDANLKDLLEKLGKEKASGPAAGEEDSDEAEDEEEFEAEESPDSIGAEEVTEETAEEEAEPDTRTEADVRRERAHQWALRAVEVAGIVRRPRGRNANLYQYEKDRQAAARRLMARVLDQGELYLARWGGTRKGSGTFYTKPGLAVPTVHRTLEPLVYNKSDDGKLVPRIPEEILAIKVCDPSCGSASFLVAALNYLTDALYQSLWVQGRVKESPTNTVITLPFGLESQAGLTEEMLPAPTSDEHFEKTLKGRLKRYVVERCIYGVDFNPMAVELARLSLWIETMDKSLPFGFLDHKIKCGNALVGCWFDRFLDYPLASWLREGGDKNHTRGVHYQKDEWTKAIKRVLSERVKPELVRQIKATRPDQIAFDFIREGIAPENLHDEAVAIFEELHELPVSTPDGIEQRERMYKEMFIENPHIKALREAFDMWCAVWFWPADRLDDEAPTPDSFYHPSGQTREIVQQLRDEIRFFHWELEFPDVFASGNGGFDAVVGNPPWEISKPNSKEFFSNYDPIYRTYGKQEALMHQTRLFESDAEIEREWLAYSARFKAMSNWAKCAASPFGDPKDDIAESISLALGNSSRILHDQWRLRREKRKGYADSAHPFRYLGSADINTYKMFLELSHAIIQHDGRMGMIVPSGLYTDKGATDLRTLFLNRCRWEWLFGFENKKGIFDIHRSFKFCPVIVTKGDETEAFNAAFMRHDLANWERPENFSLGYSRTQVTRFSPYSRAILEIRNYRDLEIIEKIYDGSVLLGDQSPDGWQIKYAAEFHMTNDSELFPPLPKWKDKGYRPDAYGRWLKGGWQPISEALGNGINCRIAGTTLDLRPGLIPSVDGNQFILEDDIEDIALPLYEGRMIGQFDFSQKGWVRGKGRGSVWREIPWNEKVVEPQYLMAISNAKENLEGTFFKGKLAIINIASATNARTMYATPLSRVPCGHSAPTLRLKNRGLTEELQLVAILNSFAYDASLRLRIGGLNLTWHYLEETALPGKDRIEAGVAQKAMRLALASQTYAPEWFYLISNPTMSYIRSVASWKCLWAITHQERLRLRCTLDAIVAELYGLSFEDFAWTLRTDPSDPKGFWRVDQDQPIELRHTTLALAAFRDLKEMGLEAFCNIPDPEGLANCGWQIPEKLTFAIRDGGIIEFDAHDGETYPVRERLGPRFQPWQLEGLAEESWAECELHARNILGEEKFRQLVERLDGKDAEQYEKQPAAVIGADGQPKLFATGQPNLFGEDES
jgi:hypothetical protein